MLAQMNVTAQHTRGMPKSYLPSCLCSRQEITSELWKNGTICI